MEKFREWYLINHKEITWFLIGFLVMDGCYNIGKGNLGGAAISFGLAWANYLFRK